MARWATQWFFFCLYLFLMFVQGNEDANESYNSERNLVLEYFLPVNVPPAVDMSTWRQKRNVEGSGEDDETFSELNGKSAEDMDNSTQNAFAKLLLQERHKSTISSLISDEGSGETDEMIESLMISSKEKKGYLDELPVTVKLLTTTGPDEITIRTITENGPEVKNELTNTDMTFDKSEGLVYTGTDEITTGTTESNLTVILDITTMGNNEEGETEFTENFSEESTTEIPKTTQDEYTISTLQESVSLKSAVTGLLLESTTELPTPTTTLILNVEFQKGISENGSPSTTEAVTTIESVEAKDFTMTSASLAVTTIPVVVPQKNMTDQHSKTVINNNVTPVISENTTVAPEVASLPPPHPPPHFPTSIAVQNATEILKKPSVAAEPILEEVFKETKIHKKLEAMPGNILQKQNLSLAADPFLVTNTRLMDSEETVQLSSAEPKRLGAYIVIGLILLSFSSLVGYITFRKRMNRKRQEFESNQESNDTEKALLSLRDYKDSSELEENHLKNNEITPIVVKSNTQINKFEKNTNFSSPKNLNTIANEKNIEKLNVLKSTAENLTQVIIEGSPKDVEDEKNVPNMEKLIVKTRIDQDSIPKKPVIVNRSSTGYMPIPQDMRD